MARNKRRDVRYTKSRAVKNSAKNAAAAAVLKRKQLKEAKGREAGNKEPSIDTDTGHEAKNNVEELVAAEEPVEEPGQELVASQRPELDQDPEIEDEPSASEDEEQKAGTEEEEPVVEPLTPKDLRIQLERLVLSQETLQKLKRVQKAKKERNVETVQRVAAAHRNEPECRPENQLEQGLLLKRPIPMVK
jgi:hypothetical protein